MNSAPPPLYPILLLAYPMMVWCVSEWCGANAVIKSLQAKQRWLYPVRWVGLILILAAVGFAFRDYRVLAGVATALSGWMFWRGTVLIRWGMRVRPEAPSPEWLRETSIRSVSLCAGGAVLLATATAGTLLWWWVLSPSLN